MRLIECPVGLFKINDTLCLKTKYILPNGRINAYVVSTGEDLFDVVNCDVTDFNSLEVTPIVLRWGCILVTNFDVIAKG